MARNTKRSRWLVAVAAVLAGLVPAWGTADAVPPTTTLPEATTTTVEGSTTTTVPDGPPVTTTLPDDTTTSTTTTVEGSPTTTVPDGPPVTTTLPDGTTTTTTVAADSMVVTGTVTNSAGAAVPFSFVSASTGMANFSTTADTDGHFELTLPSGMWTLTVMDPGMPQRAYGTFTTTLDVMVGAPPMSLTVVLPDLPALTGTVVGPDGAPVVGATVRTMGREAPTAADGTYRLAGITGPMMLAVDVLPPAGAMLRGVTGRLVQFTSTGAVLDIQLEAAGRVTGSVTDPTGSPIGGAMISVSSFSPGGPMMGMFSIGTTSDALGAYVLSGIPTGTYTLSVFANGGTWIPSRSITISVTAGATTSADVQMLPGAVLEGTVTSAEGDPISGVSVMFNGGGSSGNTMTATDGTYRITGLSTGSGIVTASPMLTSGFARRSASAAVTTGSTVTVDFVLARAAALELLVTDVAGTPISGASVSAQPANVNTGSDGRAVLEGLQPGDIALSINFWSPLGAYQGDNRELELAPGERRSLTVVLHRLGEVSGTVTDPAGDPVAGAYVYFGYPTIGAVTSADGTYRVLNVPGGAANFSVRPPAGRADLALYREPFDVVLDTVATKNVALVAGTPLPVTLESASGAPIPSASIYVYDARPGGDTAVGTTDANGEYTFTNLSPSTYSVTVSVPGRGNVFTEAAFVLAAGAANELSIRLDEVGTVSGTVTDSAGVPVEGAQVTVEPPNGGNWTTVTTDSNGQYEVNDVPSGVFHVFAASPAGDDLLNRRVSGWVAPGETVVTDIVLQIGARVSGTITISSGDSPNFISVTLRNTATNESFGNNSGLPGGGYASQVVPPGQYTVTALAGFSYGARTAIGAIELVAGASNVLDLTISATSGGTIVGTLVDAAGLPIGGATVIARQTTASFPYATATTATDGSFRFAHLIGTPFVVTASGQTGRTIAISAPVVPLAGQEISVSLIAPTPGGVSGTVRDAAGNPVTGASVQLESTNGVFGSAQVRSDASGHYEVTKLLPGPYRLVVVAPGIDKPRIVQPFEILSAQTLTQDLVVADFAIVSGEVTLPSGAPLAGVEVRLVGLDDDSLTSMMTDTVGRYRLHTPPGRWELQVIAPSPGVVAPIVLDLTSGELATRDLVVTGLEPVVVDAPPAAPVAAAAVVGTAGVEMSWTDSSSNETGFEVWRMVLDTAAGTATKQAEFLESGTSLLDTPAPGRYVYVVRALNAFGASSWAVTGVVEYGTTAPDAPSGLTATIDGTDVALSWTDGSSNETGFEIWRLRIDPATGAASIDEAWTVASATEVDTPPPGRFVYVVRAVNPFGSSGWAASGVVEFQTTPPGTPLSLTTTVGPEDVTLSWSDGNGSETGFEIWRIAVDSATGTSSVDMTTTVAATARTYVETPPIGHYVYVVRAVNEFGLSGWAVGEFVGYRTVPPAAPADLTADSATGGGIDVSWSDVSDNEDVFEVWRIEVDPATGGVEITELPLLTQHEIALHDAVPGAGVYVYVARATNGFGASAWSVSNVVFHEPPAPG